MAELSNYPPGVTGREYAISGAVSEWDEEETCPHCDWTGVMHHEAHPEFGVWAWCCNPDKPECTEFWNGFDATKDEDPDEMYDRMRDDALTEGDRT